MKRLADGNLHMAISRMGPTGADGLIKTEADGEERTLVVTITKNPTPQSGTYEIDFIGKNVRVC